MHASEEVKTCLGRFESHKGNSETLPKRIRGSKAGLSKLLSGWEKLVLKDEPQIHPQVRTFHRGIGPAWKTE